VKIRLLSLPLSLARTRAALYIETVRFYVSGTYTRHIPVIIASEHKRGRALSARGKEEARLETRFIERKFVNQGRAAPLYDRSFQAGRSIGLI